MGYIATRRSSSETAESPGYTAQIGFIHLLKVPFLL